MKALYAGEVTMVDRWLGRFLDKMEATGRMEDTFLLVLADHGVALGEHGFTGKPYNALWPELTDIPFMIRSPDGRGAGQTSDHYASTHDVASTIVGALGLLPPQQMDGQYLTLLMGEAELKQRDHFTFGYNQYVSTRDDQYALISVNDRSEAKLYDIQKDPGMNDDIAADNKDIIDRMFDDYVLKDAGGPLPRVPS
jgi:arylsulfatase A-like enzyme